MVKYLLLLVCALLVFTGVEGSWIVNQEYITSNYRKTDVNGV